MLRQLKSAAPSLPQPAQASALQLLANVERLYKRIDPLRDRRLTAMRSRVHGDFHLKQVLYTGKDFVIVDFAGDRARPPQDRRRKRSPLRDVACMLRSFDYAAGAVLLDATQIRPEDREPAQRFAQLWVTWVQAAFLDGYLVRAGLAPFVPRDRSELAVLLDAFQIEKALEQLADDLGKGEPRSENPLRWLVSMVG